MINLSRQSALERGRETVAEQIATTQEIDAAVRSLEAFEREPHSLLVGPRIYQVFARIPAPGAGTRSPLESGERR